MGHTGRFGIGLGRQLTTRAIPSLPAWFTTLTTTRTPMWLVVSAPKTAPGTYTEHSID